MDIGPDLEKIARAKGASCGLNRGRASRNFCFLPAVREENHHDSSSRQGTPAPRKSVYAYRMSTLNYFVFTTFQFFRASPLFLGNEMTDHCVALVSQGDKKYANSIISLKMIVCMRHAKLILLKIIVKKRGLRSTTAWRGLRKRNKYLFFKAQLHDRTSGISINQLYLKNPRRKSLDTHDSTGTKENGRLVTDNGHLSAASPGNIQRRWANVEPRYRSTCPADYYVRRSCLLRNWYIATMKVGNTRI